MVLTSFWGVLDEYALLLVADHGVATETILVLAVIWAGATAEAVHSPGGLDRLRRVDLEAAPRPVRPGGRRLDAARSRVRDLSGRRCGVDTRLQDTITGQSRATVTHWAPSVDAAATAVYPAVAAVVSATSYSAAFTMFAAPYLVVACVLSATSARRRRHGVVVEAAAALASR